MLIVIILGIKRQSFANYMSFVILALFQNLSHDLIFCLVMISMNYITSWLGLRTDRSLDWVTCKTFLHHLPHLGFFVKVVAHVRVLSKVLLMLSILLHARVLLSPLVSIIRSCVQCRRIEVDKLARIHLLEPGTWEEIRLVVDLRLAPSLGNNFRTSY